MTLSLISPNAFIQLASQCKIVLLDVRTPMEYEQVHAKNAVLEPLDQLNIEAVAAKYELTKQEPVYVICKSGSRARTAGQKFVEAGYEQVLCIDGGTEAWVAANLSVVRGQSKVLPLQQQVFIAVGLLVILGVVLGRFVHPAGLLLSAFVGCGLVFAGVTGKCGMAMMIAKMPWNKVSYAGKTVTSCSINQDSDKKSCCNSN
ncbi:rhodanese-like domain-containing protein [bacterium AH-315-I18]|nr:rhodanese-like domain-containing protein [Phycisphaeraceae bacterium]MBN4061083.1 rhodanese-like domain-containing protein [bacterium AH-315-I18]